MNMTANAQHEPLGHTPGPWVVPQPIVKGQGVAFSPVFATTLIAKVYSTVYEDHQQALANAHLIAAAPDMLDALVIARVHLTGIRNGLSEYKQKSNIEYNIEKIDAIIKKATKGDMTK